MIPRGCVNRTEFVRYRPSSAQGVAAAANCTVCSDYGDRTHTAGNFGSINPNGTPSAPRKTPMTARTSPRLLAAGACLLLAGGLSVANDAAPASQSPPRVGQPAFGDPQPSAHFFPGRFVTPKAPDRGEPQAPAPANQPEPVNQPEPTHEPPVAQPSVADQPLPPPLDEPPTLETRASPHFFLGHARIQMPIRRARADSQSQPIDQAVPASDAPQPQVASEPFKPTIALAAEPIQSPATLPAPQQAPSPPPAQLQSTNLQPATKLNLAAPYKILTSLPQRRSKDTSTASAALKPAAVQTVAAQQSTLVQDRLSRDGGPPAPLQPTEVFSVS